MGKDGVTIVSLAMGAGFFKKGTDGLKDGIEDTGEKLIKKEGSFLVKDIVNKKVIKIIRKWDPKVGDVVEYPMYNNVALGKSLGGKLEEFGKDVGANVWTKDTDRIFTSMYDLMESRSFENNITEVLNKTITQNDGKILFDISSVNIQKAIDGGLVHNPKLVNDGFITELELQMIMRNESWFNNVIFHEAGKVLTKEEITSKSIKFIK